MCDSCGAHETQQGQYSPPLVPREKEIFPERVTHYLNEEST